MIFRWEHSFCHHNNFFYYLCEKRVWSFWSCKVVLGDPIFRLVGTFSTHTSQPIESSTGVHPVKFLGISPLNLDDRKSIRVARWYVRGYFLGKKHNEAGHLAKKYKLVIISWSIHNHISCDWTISVCSVHQQDWNKNHRIWIQGQSRVPVLRLSYAYHDTPHMHILKENVNYWLGRNTRSTFSLLLRDLKEK